VIHIEQPARATHAEQLEVNPTHPLNENKYAQTLPAESMFMGKNKPTKSICDLSVTRYLFLENFHNSMSALQPTDIFRGAK